MHVLKKYKAVLLSGLLVVVFCVAAYCAVAERIRRTANIPTRSISFRMIR